MCLGDYGIAKDDSKDDINFAQSVFYVGHSLIRIKNRRAVLPTTTGLVVSHEPTPFFVCLAHPLKQIIAGFGFDRYADLPRMFNPVTGKVFWQHMFQPPLRGSHVAPLGGH